MIEKNYTIPINEQFEKLDGCPVCGLHEKLERQNLEYIMGAAMMEPNVRVETNKTGFCDRHFHDMLAMTNRLSIGLLLESYLDEIDRLTRIDKGCGAKELKARAAALTRANSACFVCERVESTLNKFCENIVFLWRSEPEFREKFQKQPEFCFNHSMLLFDSAVRVLKRGKYVSLFAEDLFSVTRKKLTPVREDIERFNKSFDYRNSGKDLGDARLAVENAVEYLSALSYKRVDKAAGDTPPDTSPAPDIRNSDKPAENREIPNVGE
ncbi:MAG: DUF6062 family protein [Oscillospiraceae bacterium]|nr:DUF6062 family protein [Oscillospiraceae bacterium]